MSLFTSLNTSVSGLTAGSNSMTAIANNLANANTVGYKSERTLFRTLVAAGSSLSGLTGSGGVTTLTERMQNVQGMNQNTQSPTDLSLAGAGFLAVSEGLNPEDGTFYLRSGSFQQDREGYLVEGKGNYLLGWETDGEGNIVPPQELQPVRVGSRISAQSTGQVALGLNLKASEETHSFDTSATLQDEVNNVLSNTNEADYNLEAIVHDEQGNSRNLTFSFLKRSDNRWMFTVHTQGENVIGGIDGQNFELGTGELLFNPDGTLEHATLTQVTAPWADGAPDAEINFDFGNQTGGFVFDDTTKTGNLGFTDHVIDISFDSDDPSAPLNKVGTFSFAATGGNQLELTDPDGSTWIVDVPVTAERRILEFGNGVSMTLSDQWSYPAVTPASVGTIDSKIVDPVESQSFEGIVQFAADYNPFLLEQDGFTSGTLNTIEIDREGFVNGFFTNGQTKKLWQVPIADFRAATELEMVEGNKFRATTNSGQPFYKQAASGDAAEIQSFSLEASTVDIATEFSTMIQSQRVYQANSKVMQTTDAMLNELLNMR